MIWFFEHYGIVYVAGAFCLLEILVKGMLHRTYCQRRRQLWVSLNTG